MSPSPAPLATPSPRLKYHRSSSLWEMTVLHPLRKFKGCHQYLYVIMRVKKVISAVHVHIFPLIIIFKKKNLKTRIHHIAGYFTSYPLSVETLPTVNNMYMYVTYPKFHLLRQSQVNHLHCSLSSPPTASYKNKSIKTITRYGKFSNKNLLYRKILITSHYH